MTIQAVTAPPARQTSANKRAEKIRLILEKIGGVVTEHELEYQLGKRAMPVRAHMPMLAVLEREGLAFRAGPGWSVDDYGDSWPPASEATAVLHSRRTQVARPAPKAKRRAA